MKRLCLFLLALCCNFSVYSASFNCQAKLTDTEDLICKNDELSSLDSSLATLYRQQMLLLDAAEQSILKQEQRAWLVASRSICHRKPFDASATSACLRDGYQERLDSLKNRLVLDVPGLRVFMRSEYLMAGQDSLRTVNVPRIISRHPQDASRFNQGVDAFGRSLGELSDFQVTSHIAWKSPLGISFEVIASAASERGERLAMNRGFTWFTQTGAIKASDIFLDNSDWYKKLKFECVRAVMAQKTRIFKDQRTELVPSLLKEIIKETCDEQNEGRWLVSKSGLTVLSSQIAWAAGFDHPFIAWGDLQAVLKNHPITLEKQMN